LSTSGIEHLSSACLKGTFEGYRFKCTTKVHLIGLGFRVGFHGGILGRSGGLARHSFLLLFFLFWESIARSCARPGRGNKNCSQILEKGPQVTRLYLRLHSQNILSQFSLEGSAWGRKVNQLQGCSMIGVTLLWYGGTRCINHSWTLKVSAWSHEQTVVWRKLEVGAFATRCRGDTGGRN
jgi:hypothetical protein